MKKIKLKQNALFCTLEKTKQTTNIPLSKTTPNALHMRFGSIAKFCGLDMKTLKGHSSLFCSFKKAQMSNSLNKEFKILQVALLNYISYVV